MADETQATEGTTQQTGSADQSAPRTFTQDEVNRLVGDARMRERRKYEGYVDGSEVEDLKAKAEAAQRELEDLKTQAARQEAIATVADKAGVPTEVVAMLNGADADELADQVKRLMKLLPVHPTRTDDGGANVTAKTTNAQRFAEIVDAALGI